MSYISRLGQIEISKSAFVRVIKINGKVYADIRKEFTMDEDLKRSGVCLTMEEFKSVVHYLQKKRELIDEEFESERRKITLRFFSFGVLLLLTKWNCKQMVDLSKEEILGLIASQTKVDSLIGVDEVDSTVKSNNN